MKIDKVIKKLESYKYEKSRQKYSKKVLGVKAGEVITATKMLKLIKIAIELYEQK